MKKHTLLLLLSLLFQVLACDRIENTPEPDYFTRFEPKDVRFNLTASGSGFAFNVLDSNDIKAEYQLIMGVPAFGSLVPGSSPGAYSYVPPQGFSGTDSVLYQVCLGNICKTGVVYFVVPPDPCHLKAANDSMTVALSDTLFIPVLLNDSICDGTEVSLESQPHVGYADVIGNRIRLALPLFFEGAVQCHYRIKRGDRISQAVAKVSTFLGPDYCLSNFRAVNDTLPLLQGFNFKTFKPEDLIFNDRKCTNDVQISSFSIVPNPPSNDIYELKFQQNRWWFLVKEPQDFTSGTFRYRVCSNSGKCDTATVVIRKL